MIYLDSYFVSKHLINQIKYSSLSSSVNNHIIPTIASNTPLIVKIFNKIDNCLLLFVLSSTVVSLFPRNVLNIPSVVEKIGWKLCLPASLALSILGNESLQVSSIPKNDEDKNKYSVRILAPSVVISFILGLLGSCIGGFVSYLIVSYYQNNSIMHKVVTSQHHLVPNFAACSACLASSYIGGTVNFFETADNLALLSNDMDILKQLAAADIGVMIAYFSILNMIKSFSLNKDNKTPNSNTSSDFDSTTSDLSNISNIKVSKSLKLSYFMIASISSILLSVATNMIQDHFIKIPGISIMLLTLLAVIVARHLPNYLPNKQNFNAFISSARDSSTVFLLGFYFLLGLMTRLQDLIALGNPIATIFSVLLSSHLLFAYVGSQVWNKLVLMLLSYHHHHTHPIVKRIFGIEHNQSTNIDVLYQKYLIDIDSLLIASNACVGGAATAASMAGSRLFKRADLMLSASIVGIIG